jgi:hypothetical protein
MGRFGTDDEGFSLHNFSNSAVVMNQVVDFSSWCHSLPCIGFIPS